mgnify:CR=1 FL=1
MRNLHGEKRVYVRLSLHVDHITTIFIRINMQMRNINDFVIIVKRCKTRVNIQ